MSSSSLFLKAMSWFLVVLYVTPGENLGSVGSSGDGVHCPLEVRLYAVEVLLARSIHLRRVYC
jgi:hypothetical protein